MAETKEETTPPKPPKPAFTFAGVGRLPFNIFGKGFGGTKGEVTIGGKKAEVTKWTDTKIKGKTPKVDYTKSKITITVKSGGKTQTVEHEVEEE